MVAAHSGALAGDDIGWRAFCDQTGAIRVRDLAELCDTIELFEAGRRRRSGTRGIATVHDSGAERALCADLAHDLGVEFADLGDTTLATITDLLDEGLIATNPLDLWGTGADTRTLFSSSLKAIVDDPAVAVTALAVDLVSEFDGDTAYPDAVIDVATHTDAPIAVLASVESAVDRDAANRLRASGVPVLVNARSGVAALGHLANWPLPTNTATALIDADRQQRWASRLTEPDWEAHDAFALLADYGIAVPASGVARSIDQVLTAADTVGYPVALKTLGADHKSDVGGVVLGIADDTELSDAYRAMASRLGPAVSVHAMAGSGVEVSIGIVRDENFGPLVIVAAGGTLVELIADRAVACPPISATGALDMLGSLRIAKLLDGWRGDPPADINALVDVVVGFSQLAAELGDVLDAVEANPVIASPTGAIAVDALVIARDQKIE
jgi:acyl-CoA synthetase (NDP forming)